MSTNAESTLCEGMYSKLIDNESSYFDEADVRGPDVQHHSVLAPAVRGAPRRSGPGAYRLATICLATLCAALLFSIIAVSAHYQNLYRDPSGPALQNQSEGQVQMQRQPANVTALAEALTKLQTENSALRTERDQLTARLALAAAATPATPATCKLPVATEPVATEPVATEPVATAAPNITCPPRWVLFNTSCYFISTYSMDWPESQAFCQETGAHLAIIHTPEEQTFLWDLLPRGHWNAYWFGISDETSEADWLWVDGTTLVGGFWEEGEPNNHIDEDCGYIVKTRKRERTAVKSWYDAPCGMNWPFICEKEMRPQ